MSKSLISLIEKIEIEVGHEYLPGCIKWADENFDNAWSKSIERMNKAVERFQKDGNWDAIEAEAKIFSTTQIEYIRLYKESKTQDTTLDMFEELRKKQQFLTRGQLSFDEVSA